MKKGDKVRIVNSRGEARPGTVIDAQSQPMVVGYEDVAISNDANYSQDWIDDCKHWYGKVLTGDKTHWCPEWDDLPIDENSPEFEFCLCYKDEQ